MNESFSSLTKKLQRERPECHERTPNHSDQCGGETRYNARMVRTIGRRTPTRATKEPVLPAVPIRRLEHRLVDSRGVHDSRLQSGRVRLRGGGLRILLRTVGDEDQRKAGGRDLYLADPLCGVALHGLDLFLALQTTVGGPVVRCKRLQTPRSGWGVINKEGQEGVHTLPAQVMLNFWLTVLAERRLAALLESRSQKERGAHSLHFDSLWRRRRLSSLAATDLDVRGVRHRARRVVHVVEQRDTGELIVLVDSIGWRELVVAVRE